MKYDRTVDLQVADVPGVSVNVSEFNAALKAIQDLCDEFMQNAQHAAGLTTRLHDGFGPVAEAVGNAFEHRLSSSGGAPYAISTGSGLFDQIASTLQGIITGYQQGEDAAFGAISQAGQGQ